MARIVDQIGELPALVGIQHVHGFAYGPVNGREGRFVHVVAGIFGVQVVPLTNAWLLRPPASGIVMVLLPQHSCA